ncbi:MAG TPA: RnfABCDGE type electron transport complex subunit B [Legionellaceae bacterium]|nr:RnfABCDGE type electron transport complex subunit B [Legionellaceae bacterium]
MVNSVKDIDALLPQTQCGLCGYGGCRPYAEAMMTGVAGIHLCPPGGVPTLRALGAMLHIDSEPYIAQMVQDQRMPATAIIHEVECIGCTKCIQACPVDAIIGTAKKMHHILPDECTGCGLCIEPCPVDCIEMIPVPEAQYEPDVARMRHEAKQIRILVAEEKKSQVYREKRRLINETNEGAEKKAKQEYILAAMRRVKAKS